MYSIIDISKINFEYKIKVIEHSNFRGVFIYDTLLFNTILKNIAFGVILCYIFICTIYKFDNRDDSFPVDYSVL